MFQFYDIQCYILFLFQVAYRDFSSYNKLKSLRFEDMMIKLKAIPKNAWDALGTRYKMTPP